MPEIIPQSVTKRVPLKLYLSSDHVSDATGKTLAIVISKNGAAFGNPSGGATNATEIGNGWYYVDLTTTDSGITGPLIVRGTSASCDNSEQAFTVGNAHNAGFDGIPAVTAGSTNGLPLAVDNSGRVDVLKVNGTSQTAKDLGASVTQTGDNFARLGAPAGASVSADVASIQTDTTNIKTRIPAALTGAGNIKADVQVNSDKTGYAIAIGGIINGANAAAELNNIADGTLDRIISVGTDSGADDTTHRTVRQCLRILRNKVGITAGTVTVTKEDDATTSWTGAVTTSAGNPISQIDPT